ncbi:MAG TPA: NHL repeat-containing protein [Chloroflexota bacterium]
MLSDASLVFRPRRPSAARAGIALIALFVVVNTAIEVVTLARAALVPAAVARQVWQVAVPGGFPNGGGVAVGTDGRIYATDIKPPRLRVFAANGALLATWDGRGGTVALRAPTAVAALPDGRIAVLDPGDAAIVECAPDGQHCSRLHIQSLNSSRGFTPRRDGGYYVADTGNDRVLRVDAQGRVLVSWGRYGTKPGQFGGPWSVVEAADGDIYVADNDNGRIEELTWTGTFVRELDTAGPAGGLALAGDRLYVALPAGGGIEVMRTDQRGFTRLNEQPRRAVVVPQPFGIAVAPDGSLVVADLTGLAEYAVQAP